MSLTRRRTLQLGGAAFVGGLAGCSSSVQESSKTLRLGGLDVHNNDPRPHTVHVAFFDGDNPRYWVSKKVSAGHESSPGFAHFGNYPPQPGNDVLHVRIDDQPKSRWARLDFGERNASCLGLLITIGTLTENAPGKLTIWESTSENECDGMTTVTKQ